MFRVINLTAEAFLILLPAFQFSSPPPFQRIDPTNLHLKKSSLILINPRLKVICWLGFCRFPTTEAIRVQIGRFTVRRKTWRFQSSYYVNKLICNFFFRSQKIFRLKCILDENLFFKIFIKINFFSKIINYCKFN